MLKLNRYEEGRLGTYLLEHEFKDFITKRYHYVYPDGIIDSSTKKKLEAVQPKLSFAASLISVYDENIRYGLPTFFPEIEALCNQAYEDTKRECEGLKEELERQNADRKNNAPARVREFDESLENKEEVERIVDIVLARGKLSPDSSEYRRNREYLITFLQGRKMPNGDVMQCKACKNHHYQIFSRGYTTNCRHPHFISCYYCMFCFEETCNDCTCD
jgi:hypothetical protein